MCLSFQPVMSTAQERLSYYWGECTVNTLPWHCIYIHKSIKNLCHATFIAWFHYVIWSANIPSTSVVIHEFLDIKQNRFARNNLVIASYMLGKFVFTLLPVQSPEITLNFTFHIKFDILSLWVMFTSHFIFYKTCQ